MTAKEIFEKFDGTFTTTTYESAKIKRKEYQTIKAERDAMIDLILDSLKLIPNVPGGSDHPYNVYVKMVVNTLRATGNKIEEVVK